MTRPLVGIEREWRVLDGDIVVDFREVVDDLALDGVRLDPDDPHAHRCPWGGVVTADAREAEVATPPVAVEPGATREIAALAAAGFDALRRATPERWTFDGYSTHLNVGVPDRHAVRIARRFAASFSVAQMLLLDRRDSPGLLVRPRRRRLELGGEYATGEQLRGALVFAVAATIACVDRDGPWRRVPVPDQVPERAVGRFGWYVDRAATGVDLYATGRVAQLPTSHGPMSAQSYLVAAWSALRPTASAALGTDEIAVVDALVDGDLPLPLEAPECEPAPPAAPLRSRLDGRVIEPIQRPGFVVRPTVVRWEQCAFEADDGSATAYFVVAADELSTFVETCIAGGYDEQIVVALRRRLKSAGGAKEGRRSA